MRVLEYYSSNFDDDKDIAQELLKVFYGRRDHSVGAMSEDEILKCAEIHAALALAHATKALHEHFE